LGNSAFFEELRVERAQIGNRELVEGIVLLSGVESFDTGGAAVRAAQEQTQRPLALSDEVDRRLANDSFMS